MDEKELNKFKEREKNEKDLKKQLVLKEVKDWMNKLPPEKHDEKYLVIGTRSYTPRQLVKEVEDDTDIGKMISKVSDKGRLELLKRRG